MKASTSPIAVGVSDGIVTDISLNEKFALENALYVDNTQKISERVTLRYGLRWSAFQYYGPGNKYEYQEIEGCVDGVLCHNCVIKGCNRI